MFLFFCLNITSTKLTTISQMRIEVSVGRKRKAFFVFVLMKGFFLYVGKDENENGRETLHFLHCWGHLLRSIPFLMSGHLNFKFFQALGTPLFNTNLNNGCPNMIYQHSGQAHKHFSRRFHCRSFLADVQT